VVQRFLPHRRIFVFHTPQTTPKPPRITTVADLAVGDVIESLYDAVSEVSSVPPLALREILENLVHADMEGVVVSVLDGGATVRVSDAGRGIAQPAAALEPGFTTADPDHLGLIRGVGAGLPTARGLLEAEGGSLEIVDNLGRGAAITLRVPGGRPSAAEPGLGDRATTMLALLLELDGATVARLAEELDLTAPACGRELAELEQRGVVARHEGGIRTLTASGRDLVATLF
jgi:hypothetical protein